ncbi:hypothetical protein I203_106480 [Kwoniella mangroviensis CBS 8507]|uniref:uncharacterized protein n=1 Tax=Kwoniella mangroviensis CBS 8507 TaxID=1296122 RepID=UPI00302E8747
MPYIGSCFLGSVRFKVDITQEKQVTSVSAHSTNVLPKISEVELTGDVREYSSRTASGNTATRLFFGTSGSALAHNSNAFGDAMTARGYLKTGNLPDFRTMPFAAELLVKDRWTGLPPIPEGDQA